MSEILKLYHTSSKKIKNPDVNFGRRNADFSGGFYLSDNPEFSGKWASDANNCINSYELDLTGLKVKRLFLDEEWFNYISKNRMGYDDMFSDFDVIIGPIANDTLYDTLGIITSGLLKSESALKLLSVGKKYTQINVKTEKAASQLKWLGSTVLSADEIENARNAVKNEEKEFRAAFFETLKEIDEFEMINEMLG